MAASNETPGLISDYVRSKGIRYGVVRAQGVGRAYGGKGIPHAWLIGRDGRVAWRGHPQQLTADVVEAALAGGSSSTAAFPPPQAASSIPWGLIIVVLLVLFAGAMGWFWWSTRDRTPSYAAIMWQPPPQQPQAPQAPQPSEYRPPTRQMGVGGGNAYSAGTGERTDNTEYRKRDNDAPYLGGPQA